MWIIRNNQNGKVVTLKAGGGYEDTTPTSVTTENIATFSTEITADAAITSYTTNNGLNPAHYTALDSEVYVL